MAMMHENYKPVGLFFGGLRKYRDGFIFLHYVFMACCG